MIPKNIHLIFLRKDEPFPELFEKCKQEIQVNHPDWNIRLYNKDDAQDILNQDLPEYIEAYNAFYHNVQKADFLRLALVYLYGGFYMDLDMLSLKPLDELRKYNLVLGEEKIVCQAEQEALNLRYRLRIANYMFGGIPKHPFLHRIMDEMAERATIILKSQQEILDITGPGLLTDTYWDNYGMYTAEDEAQLTYVQVGILAAVLLNSGAADYVITGCGTGEGAMLACNSFPGVICGHVEDALDAYTFAQINDGNAISLPFAKGYGWGGDLNLEYIFEKLFCEESGQGYPRERAVPEQRNKRILDDVKKVTYRELTDILMELDRELVKGALAGEHFQELFFKNCKCEKIAACVKEILGC